MIIEGIFCRLKIVVFDNRKGIVWDFGCNTFDYNKKLLGLMY